MPSPRPDESREEFVSRCMASAEATRDYPDEGQRLAVCSSLWEGGKARGDEEEPVAYGKQGLRTEAGGTDGHRHELDPRSAFTSAEHGHRHSVERDALLTGPAGTDGHRHPLPEAWVGVRFELRGEVSKLDEEQHLVYGWFSVIEEGGRPVVDTQRDVVSEKTLVDWVHSFVSDSRRGKVMHRGRKTAELVEALVFTKDVQQALGIDLGKVGAFGAFRVLDDATWEGVKSGQFRGFSIGGVGRRTPIDVR